MKRISEQKRGNKQLSVNFDEAIKPQPHYRSKLSGHQCTVNLSDRTPNQSIWGISDDQQMSLLRAVSPCNYNGPLLPITNNLETFAIRPWVKWSSLHRFCGLPAPASISRWRHVPLLDQHTTTQHRSQSAIWLRMVLVLLMIEPPCHRTSPALLFQNLRHQVMSHSCLWLADTSAV